MGGLLNLHKPLLWSTLNKSNILRLTGAGFILVCMKTKVDYLKEICSPLLTNSTLEAENSMRDTSIPHLS